MITNNCLLQKQQAFVDCLVLSVINRYYIVLSVHQIFSLTWDWSICATGLNISHLKPCVVKNIWGIINTCSGLHLEQNICKTYAWIFVLCSQKTVTLCIMHSLDLTLTCFTWLWEPMRKISLHVLSLVKCFSSTLLLS